MSKKDLQTNKEAIRILNEKETIEPTDRETLLKFKGNGSIARDIDQEYNDLLEANGVIISNTTTSFATPMPIVRLMWEVLSQIGFKSGRILEPAAHIGRFMEGQPKQNRAQSEWVMVEPDAIAHKISQKLHPDAIAQYNTRLEKSSLPENSFDLVISNFPFNNTKPFDPNLETCYQGLNIHNYFWIKSLKLLREGGLICAITSTGTLDNNPKFLENLAQAGANLISAWRLPNNTFQSENTNVTSDLIIIQKQETNSELPSWTKIRKTQRRTQVFEINQYFINHSDHLIGTLTHSQLYGIDSRKSALSSDKTIEENVEQILTTASLPKHYKEIPYSTPLKQELAPLAILQLNLYEYLLDKGNVYQKLANQQIQTITEETERIKDAINLKQTLDQVVKLETTEGETNEAIALKRNQLCEQYQQFKKKWGNLLSTKNQSILKQDYKLKNLIHSLEYKDDKNRINTSLILSDRVSYPTRQNNKPIQSATDALYYCYNQSQGELNFIKIANLCQKSKEEVIKELGEKQLIFYNPTKQVWELAFVYLNGDTKAKLYALKRANSQDWEKYQLQNNYTGLTQTNKKGEYIYLRPFLLPPADADTRCAIAEKMNEQFGIPSEMDTQAYFDANLGTPWLEPNDIEKFTAWLLETDLNQIHCSHNAEWAIWKLEAVRGEAHWLSQKSAYGTEEKDVITLINHGLNHNPPIVKRVDAEGRRLKLESSQATNNAVSKLKTIQEKLTQWLWSDFYRAFHYTKKYNQIFPREVNYYQVNQHNSQLVLKGSNSKIQLKPHQLQGIERSLIQQNTLLLWEVGTGKTYTIISAAYQAKQKGLANKPLIVVPKATITDLVKSYEELYPTAKILTIEADNFATGIAQLQCGDYDTAIITHNCFYRIPISEETKIEYMKKEIEIINTILQENNNQDIKKELEKAKLDFENQIQELTLEQQLNNSDNLEEELKTITKVYGKKLKIEKNGKLKIKRRDDEATKSLGNLEKAFSYYNNPKITYWENLGVDYVLFDECHALKNLKTPSRINKIQGANLPYTQRTMNSLLKFRYCEEVRNGKLLWATGTLPTNSLTELYVAQRFLQPQTLSEKGILSFDAWVGQFGNIETNLEITATGHQKEKSRLTQFKNLQELLDMATEITDFAKARTVLGDILPTPQYHTILSPPTDDQQEINEHLSAIDTLLQKQEDVTYINRKGEETAYNFLSLTNLGTITAIDPRNVLPKATNDPLLKLNQVGLNTYHIWEKSSDFKATQIIFCDQGIPKKNQFTNHGYLKELLISLGIPKEEIVLISEISDTKKKKLYEQINQGKVRVLIGSTEKCGTGVNIQEKLIAIHHIDLPWAPYKKQQREGRIIRRGNRFKSVHIFQYGTLGKDNHIGFDTYKSKRIADKTKFVEQFTSGHLTANQRQTDDLEENSISNSIVSALLNGSQLQLKRLEYEKQLILTQQNLNKAKQQCASRVREAKNLPKQIAKLHEILEISQKSYEQLKKAPKNQQLISRDTITGAYRVELSETTYEFKSQQQAIKFINKIRSGEYYLKNQEKLRQLKVQQEQLPKTVKILEDEIENLTNQSNKLKTQIDELNTNEDQEAKPTKILDLDLRASRPVELKKSDIQTITSTGFYQIIDIEGKTENSFDIYQEIKAQCEQLTPRKKFPSPTQLELRIPKQSTKGKQLYLL